MPNTTAFLERIGVNVIKRQNGQLVTDCPDCGKAKHYYIADDTGLGYCHVCGYKSNPYQLAQKAIAFNSAAETMALLAEFGLAEPRAEAQPQRRPRIGDTRPLTTEEEAQICQSKQISIEALRALQPVYAEQHGQKLALLPAYNPTEPHRPCGWLRVRLDGRSVQLGRGREEKYPIIKNSRHGLLGLSQKEGDILFCEAWRDACAAISQGYYAIASSGGASTWRDEWLPAFSGRKVYLIFDRDAAGDQAARRAAKAIAGVAQSVYIATLPYDLTESHGKDLHDYVSDGDSVAELLSGAVEYQVEEENTALPDEHPLTLAEDFIAKSPCRWVCHESYGWAACQDEKYELVSDQEMTWNVRRHLNTCLIHKKIGKEWQDVRLKVTRSTVLEVLEALAEIVSMSAKITPPAWIGNSQGMPDASNIIAMNNCLLDISGDEPKAMPLTADFFTVNYLPYDYDPEADCPQWREFAEQLFTEIDYVEYEGEYYPQYHPDETSTSLLQEWMGYLLTHDTKYQKILGIVGPPRSGKGTTGRVIRGLIGDHNCSPTTLNALCADFGLQSMITSTAVLVSDASLGGRHVETTRAVEQLKSISGEDEQLINRKHKTPIKAVLSVRFVIMANEIQALHDPSGALASRFLYLVTTQDHRGGEDLSLSDRLLTELPGIFNWALQGLRRLRERRYFVESEAGKVVREEFAKLSSPIMDYYEDCCVDDPCAEETIEDLYKVYVPWCEDNGRKRLSKKKFSTDLVAAFHHLRRGRKHVDGKRSRTVCGVRLLVSVPGNETYGHDM